MATTAAVKNRSDVVRTICCMTLDETMAEEQMRPEFVFKLLNPSATATMRIHEKIGNSAPSARCEECEPYYLSRSHLGPRLFVGYGSFCE